MLIESSRDILNLVLAFSILWLSIFLVWFIYYLAMMFRQFYLIIKQTRERLEKVDEVIKSLKKKMEVGTSYLILVEGLAKKIIEAVKDKDGECSSKKSRK
jgi:preprotein translocase subunit YajC